MLISCSSARAWECTVPGQIRVQVPNGTKGNGTGNGDGQVDTVEGIEFQCQTPKTGAGDTHQSQKQHQDQNQSQSSNNTNNNKNSNSNSNQNNNSSNSTSSSTSSASNNGNGNGNNSNDSVTNIQAPKIPVQTAYAPLVAPTVQCFKGISGGAQTMAFGMSLGGGKIDENCAILEASRLAPSQEARCKVYISNKYAKKAGVTMEDCLRQPTPSVSTAVSPEPQPKVIISPETAPVAGIAIGTIVPVIAEAPKTVLTDLGSFRVLRSTSSGVCPSVRVALGAHGISILDQAIKTSKDQLGAIILSGNVYTTAVVTGYLKRHGISRVIVKAEDDQDGVVNVQVWTGL